MEEVYYGKGVLLKMCTMRMRKGKKYILAIKKTEKRKQVHYRKKRLIGY